MTEEPSTADRFHSLFRGATRSHGTYVSEDAEEGGKRTIKRTAQTLRSPPTLELWEQHLSGTRPLGVVPIMESDECLWGAVDIDDYTIDIAALAGELVSLSIPAIVCRTKSGGAHVYLFFSDPLPAAEVVPRLRELAALLGHGGSEIFPKQTTVLAARGDLGSWLNMPYYGGDKTERYAIRPDGRGMSMDVFLSRAEALRLSGSALSSLVLRRTSPGVGFERGPPCLESLTSTGFPPHTRNNGILALGVLAKRMNPDGWEALLESWVSEHGGDPPFSTAELQAIIKSLRRKDYQYRCSDTPLSMRCNVALCRTREFGVGGGAGGSVSVLESASVLATDPPIFFVVLKTGGTVELSAHQLLSSTEFQHAVLVQLREVVPEYRRPDWMRWVQQIVQDAVIVEAPRDSGTRGQFGEILEQFLTDRHRAETRDEVVMGKPWRDEMNGHVYFRLRDLEAACDRVRFNSPERGVSLRSWLTARIREMGGEAQQFKSLGRNVLAWAVDAERFQWSAEIAPLPPADDSPL